MDSLSSVQYVWTLDHLIRAVIIEEPALGPVYILKEDVSNRFYHIGLRPIDAPNLGLIFTSDVSGEELVAILITLTMGHKNYPPILCTPTETVADPEMQPCAATSRLASTN